MTEKIMNGLLIFAAKLSSQRHLQAIRNGFSELLPVVVTGAFCTLISNVVCNVRPGYISLANLPGMSWLGSLNPVFTAANYGTMSFITIGIVILIWNQGLCSCACSTWLIYLSMFDLRYIGL